jgi:ribosomal protein L37AE/L43A
MNYAGYTENTALCLSIKTTGTRHRYKLYKDILLPVSLLSEDSLKEVEEMEMRREAYEGVVHSKQINLFGEQYQQKVLESLRKEKAALFGFLLAKEWVENYNENTGDRLRVTGVVTKKEHKKKMRIYTCYNCGIKYAGNNSLNFQVYRGAFYMEPEEQHYCCQACFDEAAELRNNRTFKCDVCDRTIKEEETPGVLNYRKEDEFPYGIICVSCLRAETLEMGVPTEAVDYRMYALPYERESLVGWDNICNCNSKRDFPTAVIKAAIGMRKKVLVRDYCGAISVYARPYDCRQDVARKYLRNQTAETRMLIPPERVFGSECEAKKSGIKYPFEAFHAIIAGLITESDLTVHSTTMCSFGYDPEDITAMIAEYIQLSEKERKLNELKRYF